MDEAGLALLRSIEALMREISEKLSRHGDVTDQLARLRRGSRERSARARAKSRDGDATETRHGNVTGDYRGKDLEQEKKKELPPNPQSRHGNATPKERVWAFWQAHLGKASTAKFDKKRQRAVEGRLRDGYTEEQICEAIKGCKLDPFSMGQNERNTRYDDIALICRDAAHVDKFIAFTKSKPTNGTNGHGQLIEGGAEFARLKAEGAERAKREIERTRKLIEGIG